MMRVMSRSETTGINTRLGGLAENARGHTRDLGHSCVEQVMELIVLSIIAVGIIGLLATDLTPKTKNVIAVVLFVILLIVLALAYFTPVRAGG